MKWLHIGWRRLKRAVSGIPSTDRWLILFMAVLLAQSAYILLAGTGNRAESGDIDVIVRTASAAIFGYFLSAKGRRSPGGQMGADGYLVTAAAVIGLFCLLVLLARRNLPLEDPAAAGSGTATATVAQFRDFVSGCVGLLIGVPTGRTAPPSGE